MERFLERLYKLYPFDKLASCLIGFGDSYKLKVLDYDMLIEYLNASIPKRAVAQMNRAVKGILIVEKRYWPDLSCF